MFIIYYLSDTVNRQWAVQLLKHSTEVQTVKETWPGFIEQVPSSAVAWSIIVVQVGAMKTQGYQGELLQASNGHLRNNCKHACRGNVILALHLSRH